MELGEYLAVLRKYWLLIGLAAVAGAAGTYLWSGSLDPTYRVSAGVFVAVPHSETLGERVQAASYTERRIGSYAELATTPYVLEPVIDRLDLDVSARALSRSIEVSSPLETDVLDIAVSSSDPERAARIANEVSAELARAVAELEGNGARGEPAVQLTVIAEATPPSWPIGPNTKLNTATGLAAGLALGVFLALARTLLDTRVRNLKDVRRVTAVAVVASVRRDRRTKTDPLAMRSEPFGDRAESYRRLRTNLRFLSPDTSSRSLLVTSSVPGEGKTTTAANLAIALADGSARILLIDADLRNPAVARQMGIEGAAGLTHVLIGEVELEDVVQPWSESLDVLAAGQLPPNPAELLDSSAMAALLERARDQYDVVILDTPPLVPVTDAAALAAHVDGILLVVGCGLVPRARLADALTALEAVGANLLGLVLNRVARAEAGAAYVYGAETSGRWGRWRRPRPGADLRAFGPRRSAASPAMRFEPATAVADLRSDDQAATAVLATWLTPSQRRAGDDVVTMPLPRLGGRDRTGVHEDAPLGEEEENVAVEQNSGTPGSGEPADEAESSAHDLIAHQEMVSQPTGSNESAG